MAKNNGGLQRTQGVMAGVCGGLSQQIGISPIWLRLAFIIAAVFYGTGVGLYLLLWALMPPHNIFKGVAWVILVAALAWWVFG